MFDPSTLNAAQLEAVTAKDGPVLVIAGAGSGKTRTLVHRLAWLTEQGVRAEDMLLLTFTRKASREMLQRAQDLLGYSLGQVHGGTFHGFAYNILRRHRPEWAQGQVTVMDASDCTAALQQCRADLNIARGNRSFPKPQSVLGLLSKARNKELALSDILQRDAAHLLAYGDDLLRLEAAYTDYKRAHDLLDYDDLLFELEALLRGPLAGAFRDRYRYLLVDEYQDTNKVQARLVRLLAGSAGNVMAVGDDAQSIYAFRGADVRNILDFPTLFPGTTIIRLEENYRSTRPVLDVANAVLSGALEGYAKTLFTRRQGGAPVRLIRPLSDHSQARLVARRIEELLETYRPCEIAVLFRAGFHSYHLEIELNRMGRRFRKYGGLKYTEAAHIKDVLAYARLVVNPLDLPSFLRMASLCQGIGPKTAQRIYQAAAGGDQAALSKACAKHQALKEDLDLLNALRSESAAPEALLRRIIEHYTPRMEAAYPDDWPRRLQGLEEMANIAATYTELDDFVASLALENPEDEETGQEEDSVVLSTIHSAKGLEWDVVILLDLVEDRFPSRHAVVHPEDFEEERRLMYVACTRARERLELCVPRSLYSRQEQGSCPAAPSPFLNELRPGQYEEWLEGYSGQLSRRDADARLAAWAAQPPASLVRPFHAMPATPASKEILPSDEVPEGPAHEPIAPAAGNGPCGFCRHRIFGRGKIVERIPPDKCRVNFPGLGLKVILTHYLIMEDQS